MKAAAFKARGAQVLVGDALNPAAVGQAAQGTEHIVSLVAVRRNRPQSFLEVNVDGPRILGQAAKAAGSQSVILVSAIGARLDPKYKYLTSRWMGEQELSKTGVRGTILRFSYVLAEEGGILAEFERAAKPRYSRSCARTPPAAWSRRSTSRTCWGRSSSSAAPRW